LIDSHAAEELAIKSLLNVDAIDLLFSQPACPNSQTIGNFGSIEEELLPMLWPVRPTGG
jgi:hypothetical protein